MNKTMIIVGAILLINIVAFLLYVVDKQKAIKGTWRISERSLILWSLFAPWGGYAGMKIARHKTNHKKFTILLPVFMVLQIVLFAGYIYHYYI